MKSYKELIVWKKSFSLVTKLYNILQEMPANETYGLTSQLKRCAVSIPSNIAEGYGRQSQKSFAQYLKISRGSLFELETQLYLSNDLEFLSNEELQLLLIQVTSCKKLLNGFINYYRKNVT